MKTVREQATKCKELRQRLVAWVEGQVRIDQAELDDLCGRLRRMTPGPYKERARERIAELREHMPWTLGVEIADDAKVAFARAGIITSGEVLMKELRYAQRRGEIRKRIRPGTRYVEYTTIETEVRGLEPRERRGPPAASPTEAPGVLFDNSNKVHGQDRRGRHGR